MWWPLPAVPRALQVRRTLHFFLSHFQKETNDMVAKLFLLFQAHGCWAWLDMAADDLTLEGMRQGVDDSDMFLLALSRGVLFRPFCIAEIYHAIQAGKAIVLVSEEGGARPGTFLFFASSNLLLRGGVVRRAVWERP